MFRIFSLFWELLSVWVKYFLNDFLAYTFFCNTAYYWYRASVEF